MRKSQRTKSRSCVLRHGIVMGGGVGLVLREARTFARLEECFRLEFRLISRRVSEPDLYEGVRAALIDEDRKPTWIPAASRGVSPGVVDA